MFNSSEETFSPDNRVANYQGLTPKWKRGKFKYEMTNLYLAPHPSTIDNGTKKKKNNKTAFTNFYVTTLKVYNLINCLNCILFGTGGFVKGYSLVAIKK